MSNNDRKGKKRRPVDLDSVHRNRRSRRNTRPVNVDSVDNRRIKNQSSGWLNTTVEYAMKNSGIVTVALATLFAIGFLSSYKRPPKLPSVYPNSAGATTSTIDIPLGDLVADTNIPYSYIPPKKVDLNFPSPIGKGEQDLIENIKTAGNYFDQRTFKLDRGIGQYIGVLPRDFIQKLSISDHWMDMGCGHAIASLEYRLGTVLKENSKEIKRMLEGKLKSDFNKAMNEDPSRKANVTGVRYEILTDFSISPDIGVTILEGKLLEDIPNSTLTGEYGKADIITDVHGPIAYSPRIDLVISKYLALLKKGGAIYTFIANNYENLENYVYIPSGKALYLGKWVESLDRIPGLSVTSKELVISDGAELKIVKMWDSVSSIPSLRLLSVRETNPPSRVYEQLQIGDYESSTTGQHVSIMADSSPTLADCSMSSLMGYNIDESKIAVRISDYNQETNSTFHVANTAENIKVLDSLMKPRMRIQGFSIDTTTIEDITIAEFSKEGRFLKSSYLEFGQ